MNYKKFKKYVDEMNKNISIKLKDNAEELAFYTELVKRFNEICKENEELKKQLEYLRSGEYYNQLRFENKMLQDVVNNGEVSKEDKKFIDCTHRNTELLEQQQEFIKYLEDDLKSMNPKDLDIGKLNLRWNDQTMMRYTTIYEILSKYKEIIGENKDE